MTPRRSQPAKPRGDTNYQVAAALRPRLEQARLDLLALFRALDQLHLSQELPDELHDLFVLDADFAEALCVLDQPSRPLDWTAMKRDTLASLEEINAARQYFLDGLPPKPRNKLEARTQMLRADLKPEDAYLLIPGRDPQVG